MNECVASYETERTERRKKPSGNEGSDSRSSSRHGDKWRLRLLLLLSAASSARRGRDGFCRGSLWGGDGDGRGLLSLLFYSTLSPFFFFFLGPDRTGPDRIRSNHRSDHRSGFVRCDVCARE